VRRPRRAGGHAVVTELKRAEERLTEAVASQQAITDGVIAALSRTVEVRDPYTAGHERRVSELAAAIAGEMGLGEDRVQGVRVAEMTLQHHERLDGSGYPRGLSREHQLLEARILALADVVEAMSSHRPYRAALGHEKALEEVGRGAGIVYDGDAVAACDELFRSRRAAAWRGFPARRCRPSRARSRAGTRPPPTNSPWGCRPHSVRARPADRSFSAVGDPLVPGAAAPAAGCRTALRHTVRRCLPRRRSE
jgi:hypothetical protein